MSHDERIVCVALRLSDGTTLVRPIPDRHASLMLDVEALVAMKPHLEREYGFLTSSGRFVNRQEAYDIAKQAKQIVRNTNRSVLYSEDMW